MSSNPSNEVRLNVDLNHVSEIARKGIRRAAVFMGLGVNAADSPHLENYELYQDTTIRLLPGTVPPEVLKEWKYQFRLWVVSGGFREVVDSLSKYFDQIYLACSIATSRKHEPTRQEQFEYKGLYKKIRALRDEFGITSVNAPLIESFYPVRNCLVHRLGRVGHADATPGAPLMLRYRRFEFVHTTERGETIRLPDLMDPKAEPFVCQEAGSLGVQYAERSLQFALGSVVSFAPRELTEILFFTNQFLFEFNQAVLGYAARIGAFTPAPSPASNPQDLGAPPTN